LTKAPPAIVPPPVRAIVFNITIAAIGLAITFFILIHESADLGWLCFNLCIVRGLRLSNIVSKSVHRNETIIAIKELTINLVNIWFLFDDNYTEK
jgi:hypothetical protein